MRTSSTDRRSFVQRIAGWFLAAAATPLAAAAQQADSASSGSGGAQEPAARTLPQALASNDRELLARFVSRNGRVAGGARLGDRVEAMKLLAHGPTRRASPTDASGKHREACVACQAAAAVLLRSSAGNPQEFRAFVDGVGGRAWMERAMGSFEHAELRSAIQTGLAGMGR